jgi:HTH-type transcriptional regulator / antitoxin HigA
MATVPLDFRKPHPLRNEAEYEAAVAEIDALVERDPAPGTEDGDRLDMLAILVEAYESERYPAAQATPLEVVAFLMDQRGMTRADLEPLLGSKSRVSEFLSGARDLSKAQIRKLSDHFHVSPAVFFG